MSGTANVETKVGRFTPHKMKLADHMISIGMCIDAKRNNLLSFSALKLCSFPFWKQPPVFMMSATEAFPSFKILGAPDIV